MGQCFGIPDPLSSIFSCLSVSPGFLSCFLRVCVWAVRFVEFRTWSLESDIWINRPHSLGGQEPKSFFPSGIPQRIISRKRNAWAGQEAKRAKMLVGNAKLGRGQIMMSFRIFNLSSQQRSSRNRTFGTKHHDRGSGPGPIYMLFLPPLESYLGIFFLPVRLASLLAEDLNCTYPPYLLPF